MKRTSQEFIQEAQTYVKNQGIQEENQKAKS
jgi:hypothetical protein